MREYPDPQQHLDAYISRAADKYISGLSKRGLKHSPILAKEKARQTAMESARAYQKDANEVYEHNIQFIEQQYHLRNRQIDREGSSMGLKIFPFMVIAFAFVAWYNFSQGDGVTALMFAAGALLCLVLLIHAFRHR